MKPLFKRLFFLFLTALPYLLFTLLFLQSRETGTHYLEFDVLLKELVNGLAIKARGNFPQLLLYVFMSTIIIATIIRWTQKNTRNNYLLSVSLFFLVFYFIAPNDIGKAGVLSIRYHYFFWLVLCIWLVKNPLKQSYLNWSLVAIAVLFGAVKSIGFHEWQRKLHVSAKQVIEASYRIPEKQIIYPLFSSNVWEHYHISSLFGTHRNHLILENNAARHDYFPIRYKSNYEEQIEAHRMLEIQNGAAKYPVDYLLIIGKEPIENELHQAFYKKAKDNGLKVFENQLVELWKLD